MIEGVPDDDHDDCGDVQVRGQGGVGVRSILMCSALCAHYSCDH